MKFVDLPDICKQRREQLGFSPNYVAKQIGMNHESFRNFEEHHLQKISLDHLDRLMKVLRFEDITISPNYGVEVPQAVVISNLAPRFQNVVKEAIKRDAALRKAQMIHEHEKDAD